MQRLIKIIDRLRGKTGVHLVDVHYEHILSDIPTHNLPREEEVIYFGDVNYEVSRILHTYKHYRHVILIVLVPMEDIFNKDKE